MLFYCWASVTDSDIPLGQQRDKSMCVLGTLNAIPFDKQLYLSKRAKAQWGLIREIPINLS